MMTVEVNAKPDEGTMLAALSACAYLGEHEWGKWIHTYTGYVEPCLLTIHLAFNILLLFFEFFLKLLACQER